MNPNELMEQLNLRIVAGVIAAPMLANDKGDIFTRMGVDSRTGEQLTPEQRLEKARDRVRQTLHASVWCARELARISQLPDDQLEEGP